MKTTLQINPIDPADYYIPMRGDPRLHDERAWFGTSDEQKSRPQDKRNQVIGVVVRDKIDDDYGFVVLTWNPEPDTHGFACVDVEHSFATEQEAQARLFAAIERAYADILGPGGARPREGSMERKRSSN